MASKPPSQDLQDNPVEDKDPHHIALRRSERFKAEIESADPITARQLLAAWKEIIIENCVKAVRETNHLDALATLDSQAGVLLRFILLDQDGNGGGVL